MSGAQAVGDGGESPADATPSSEAVAETAAQSSVETATSTTTTTTTSDEAAATSDSPSSGGGEASSGDGGDGEEEDVDLTQIEKYAGEDVSASDEEIRREVWLGVVPIVIALHDDGSLASSEAPSPYYVMASRLSYLPLVCADAVDYYRALYPSLPPASDFWFEAATSSQLASVSSSGASAAASSSSSTSASPSPPGRVPLKWQYPVGVLFDMYGSAGCYPWKLTLRYRDYPPQLLRCDAGADTVRSYYMQLLKEANYLKFRTRSQLPRMTLKQQRNLWQAVSALPPHYDLFHQIIQPLAVDPVVSLAVRVLQPLRHGSFVQSPVGPLCPDGSEKTLRAVMLELMGADFSPASQRVIVHGINIPLDSSIVWLSKICMHADHFLWLVVV